jgi:hypothetical protein
MIPSPEKRGRKALFLVAMKAVAGIEPAPAWAMPVSQ